MGTAVDTEQDGWVKKSPLLDGSGTYRVNGVVYKLATDTISGRRYWFAYLDGKEVVKGTFKFTIVLKRLRNLNPKRTVE